MTEEQEDRLIDVLQHTEHEKLTTWERDRLVEWGNVYEKHGADFRLSPKQWVIIDRIYTKIYGVGLLLVAFLFFATSAIAGQLTLSWTDNALDEQGFRIERCQVFAPATLCSNFTQLVNIASAPSVGETALWINTGLAVGQTYCYRVRAYNATGNSGYTNVACAVVPVPTVPLAPTELSAQ